jgi:hypothetical protein
VVTYQTIARDVNTYMRGGTFEETPQINLGKNPCLWRKTNTKEQTES